MKKAITNSSIYAMLICIVTFASTSKLNAQCTPVISSSNPSSCTGGTVTLSVGVPGNAVGITSQYISLGNNAGLRTFMKNAFTLETWVKPNSTAGSQIIMYNGLCNQACPTFSLTIGGEGGCAGGNVANKYNFKFATTAGNFNLVSTGAATTSWTHVAITYNGSNSMKMYINGSLDNTLTMSGTPSSTSFLFIGSDPGIGGCGSSRFQLNATLDEMRIWNVERSASEINNNYANTVASNSTNLLAYYPFNSASGTTAFDATSNGYNGDIAGTPTWSASTAFGFTSFVWSPGGATTSSITVSTSGTYSVTGTTASGCTGTASKTINTSSATSSSSTITACGNYTWNGVTYTSSGTYTKTGLVNSKGCDSTANLTLTIKNTSSSSNSVNICSSQLPYVWNGLTFTGNATQTAHLTNAGGCDSSATLTITVVTVVTPSVIISTASSTVCSGDNVNFGAIPTNGGSSPAFQWNKNGVSVGSGSSISFLPNTLTNGDVISCILTANNTCQTTATAGSNKVTLTVKASPAITSITNGVSNITSASLCILNNTYNYFDATSYGVWNSSNPSVASVTGGSQSGVVKANANGTATISYNVTATNGCVSSANLAVTVAQQATPNAIAGSNIVCVGSTTALSSTTTGGVWSSPNDRGTINATTGVYTGANAGNWGEAKYTVTNAAGCSAVISRTIIVNAIPNVPTITYAPGTVGNPQAGAPTGGFCVGKKFRVAGTPNIPAGVWSGTGGVVITGYDTVNINAAIPGSIKYTYTDANGCSNSRTMSATGYTCASRGVNTVDGQLSTVDGFTMYPNPAKSSINLNVETLIGKGSIVVTDLYGKAVKTQTLSMGTNTVNTSNLSKGFYLVSIITSEGKTTKKLVVE